MKPSESDTYVRAGSDHHSALIGGFVALMGVLVYLNALGNPFVYDDHRLILENLSLQSLSDWRALIWHDVSRPLVNVSYAIDYAIWGGAIPFGFHLTNLAIHIANVLLLYRVARGLAIDQAALEHDAEPSFASATSAALLFAVHPILTQAVGYVSARPELLCAMFLLVAFDCARRAIRGGSSVLWCAAFGAWLLALASKEIAAMFPFALLAYDRLLSPSDGTARRKRLWALHVPFVTLTLAAAAIRLLVLVDIEHPAATIVRWRFGLVELDVFLRYLQLMLLPVGQTIFHAISPIESLMAPRALAGVATVLLVMWVIWRLRTQGAISFGLAWFVLLLLPSAALVVLDRGEPMAEHRLYTASIGFFLAAGSAAGVAARWASRMSGQSARRVRHAGLLIVALLSMRTISRNVVWHRPVELWLEAAEYAPDHWLPRIGLGEALHEDGRHEEAIAMFRQAVALRPTDTMAYAKLGQCQLEMGHMDDAQASFLRLRELAPDSTAASTGLGLIALRSRDARVARGYFLEALAQEPHNVPMRQALAQAAEEFDPSEALRLCEEIQRLAPQTPGNEECISRNRERVLAADVQRP